MTVKFCWECGNKLWGNHKVVKIIDEQPRTLHKECAKLYPGCEIIYISPDDKLDKKGSER